MSADFQRLHHPIQDHDDDDDHHHGDDDDDHDGDDDDQGIGIMMIVMSTWAVFPDGSTTPSNTITNSNLQLSICRKHGGDPIMVEGSTLSKLV